MSKFMNNSNCKVFTSFQRRSYIGNESHELSEIYNDEINISIWQRKIDDHLLKVASEIIEADPRLQISKLIKPEEVEEILFSKLGLGDDILYFSEDIKELVNMFCYTSLRRYIFWLNWRLNQRLPSLRFEIKNYIYTCKYGYKVANFSSKFT